MNSKGISAVIIWIIGIVIVLAITAILWATIQSFVNTGLSEATACQDLFNQVHLNQAFTCNSPEPDGYTNPNPGFTGDYTLVSFDIGDIVLDTVILRVQDESGSKPSFELIDERSVGKVGMYKGKEKSSIGSVIELPKPYGGRTYVLRAGAGANLVEIIPKVNGKECGAMDNLELRTCGDEIQENVNIYMRGCANGDCSEVSGGGSWEDVTSLISEPDFLSEGDWTSSGSGICTIAGGIAKCSSESNYFQSINLPDATDYRLCADIRYDALEGFGDGYISLAGEELIITELTTSFEQKCLIKTSITGTQVIRVGSNLGDVDIDSVTLEKFVP